MPSSTWLVVAEAELRTAAVEASRSSREFHECLIKARGGCNREPLSLTDPWNQPLAIMNASKGCLLTNSGSNAKGCAASE